MITNIYRINTKNCGDMSSSPLNYFNFSGNHQKLCIVKSVEYKTSGFTIVGGGGLFYNEWQYFWNNYFKFKKGINIIWGLGLNYHSELFRNKYPKLIENFDLIGVRDYGQGLRWVPCPSCMHSCFDNEYIVNKKVSVFEHVENKIETDLPKLTNNRTIEEAAEFLGSSECVVTNSYHGVYWATLLKKKVIAIPVETSSRFFFFKHPPLIKNELSLDFTKCSSYENALEECRGSNIKYYKDCLEIFNKYKRKESKFL